MLCNIIEEVANITTTSTAPINNFNGNDDELISSDEDTVLEVLLEAKI